MGYAVRLVPMLQRGNANPVAPAATIINFHISEVELVVSALARESHQIRGGFIISSCYLSELFQLTREVFNQFSPS